MLQTAESSGEQTQAWKRWEGRLVGGAFRLSEYLGGSQTSAVFLTECQGQKAAIKLVHADPATGEHILEQWRQAARLNHPHLVRLFEMGPIDDADLLFLIEEYAEENLAQVLPQRALTPGEVRELLPPALEALAYLHKQGFVHGHITPANIMAAGDQLKLSSDSLCLVGEAGPPAEPSAYDPPELANGVISPAGDVWRLGVTLWEALTQKLPTWRESEELPQLSAAVPTEFRELVVRCLQRDPQQRCTVDEIAAWMREPVRHPLMASRLRTTVRPQQARVAAPKKQVPLATLGMIGAVAVVLVLGIALVAGRWNRQSDTQNTEINAPDESKAEAKSEKPTPVKGKSSTQAGGRERLAATEVGAAPSVGAQPTGRGLTQAEVVSQVLPDAPQKAIDTITGHFWVSVRVQVDPSGNVVGADFASRGPSPYFAKLALDAARNWKFAPRSNVQRRQGTLQFQFEHGSIKAMPVR